MNSPERPEAIAAPPLSDLAFAALMPAGTEDGAEARWLAACRDRLPAAESTTTGDLWRLWCAAPPPVDQPLHALARQLDLSLSEVVAVALAARVELDLYAGRVLAWLQAPTGGSRPTAGLAATVAQALEGSDLARHLAPLSAGAARTSGLLMAESDNRPLPETCLRVPQATVLALAGIRSSWPGLPQDRDGKSEPPLPPSVQDAVARHAHALTRASHAEPAALAIRCGHPKEARAVARALALALGAEAVFLESDAPAGLGPWLWLSGAIPVVCAELAPGEVRRLPDLPGYRGPMLVAAGVDGSFEREGDPVGNWRVPLPTADERVVIWRRHLEAELAERIGRQHRHSPAHIEYLGRAAHHQAHLAGDARLDERHVKHAARNGAAGELGTLAQLMSEEIAEDALVVPPELRAALRLLQSRCRAREGLADPLGPSARTRYRPGVRALFVGPSGTGKTLAVAWLACSLGLPLYRVDLASVVSKYIGETEKNLAQLFARAEHAEVVLLFDEADSLFGKRTDVKDANDRFANQQTNYLLQRIESFDGIAVLTSNSRNRFDNAFTRRLDTILEFPTPGPEERRALWLAHLGTHHSLDVTHLNRIAATCDLCGGHIRNAALTAASLSQAAIDYAALCTAIESEYRKLGRQMPPGL